LAVVPYAKLSEPELVPRVLACNDQVFMVNPSIVAMLRQTLQAGYSVWPVGGRWEDGKSLIRRIDGATEASYAQALEAAAIAKEELLQAWEKAYGRNPDPSDCWDHSIKAVEAAMKPVVVPNQAQPQFGHVVGQLAPSPKPGASYWETTSRLCSRCCASCGPTRILTDRWKNVVSLRKTKPRRSFTWQ
jgi:hypothetical protein